MSLHARLREQLCVVLTAFGYFSRLPISQRVAFSESRLAASGRYFPVVGWVVGLIGALVFLAAARWWPVGIAILLSMAATLLATGALHEDGLADCCDAFGGGHQRDDVLRIMKDSRIGAFGAIGLIVALALKWQALSTIAAASPWLAASTMVGAHAASRAGAIVYMTTLDYARPDGKAAPFARHRQSWGTVVIALALGLPGLFWPDWRCGVLSVACGMVLHVGMGRWFKRRIGGYTGDCLGFAQQMLEILFYLVMLGWISS